MKFIVKNALVPADRLKRIVMSGEALRKEMQQVVRASDWSSPFAPLLLVDESPAAIESLARKHADVDVLVVIGIGGSNLGTIDVHDAVHGRGVEHAHRVLFVDTVDADKVAREVAVVQDALKAGKRVLVNVVTKSGTTTETIANFHVFYEVLVKAGRDPKEHVVCTTDKESKLAQVAATLGIPVLEIPKMVGGRYSVFSAVGLFPLRVLGVSVRNLLKGASQMRTLCLKKAGNPALLSASVLKFHHDSGKTIHDLFCFSTDLEAVGKWYRQLMGESIGKEHDERGRRVLEGMTPTVSIGSTDLHSMAQLYLGGPFDKVTTIVSVESVSSVKVPQIAELQGLVDDVQGKSLQDIMNAIVSGVESALRKANRPFMSIALADKKEEAIGELLMMFEMQMMYLGHLLKVNPFDQPAVEKYKVETRKALRKG